MSIYNELYKIASANYGLQMKDPVFSAFDKLYSDPKFELLKTFIDNDYADVEDSLDDYFTARTIGRIIKCIITLYSFINGRKGYYAKHENPEPEETVDYWINILAHELVNASSEYTGDVLPVTGSGIVNGSKMRAAVYHLLDILQYGNSVSDEIHTIRINTSGYFLGRDANILTLYGNESGVGEQIIGTDNYFVNCYIDDMYNPMATPLLCTFTFEGPLYEGAYTTFYIPEETIATFGLNKFSLYKIWLEDTTTDVAVSFNATRTRYTPNVSDYIYAKYGTNNENIMTIKYNGTDKEIIMPTNFESVNDSLKIVGNTTFMGKGMKRVEIPEGVTRIE